MRKNKAFLKDFDIYCYKSIIKVIIMKKIRIQLDYSIFSIMTCEVVVSP